jgi:hypothetical protein
MILGRRYKYEYLGTEVILEAVSDQIGDYTKCKIIQVISGGFTLGKIGEWSMSSCYDNDYTELVGQYASEEPNAPEEPNSKKETEKTYER